MSAGLGYFVSGQQEPPQTPHASLEPSLGHCLSLIQPLRCCMATRGDLITSVELPKRGGVREVTREDVVYPCKLGDGVAP